MPDASSRSVRIFSLDREAAVALLRAAARRLVDADPSVERAILFGSLVRGNYIAGSDADVAVILKNSAHRIWFERIPALMGWFADVGVPVDLFPYTLEEIEEARGNPFFHEIQQGEVLAERAT